MVAAALLTLVLGLLLKRGSSLLLASSIVLSMVGIFTMSSVRQQVHGWMGEGRHRRKLNARRADADQSTKNVHVSALSARDDLSEREDEEGHDVPLPHEDEREFELDWQSWQETAIRGLDSREAERLDTTVPRAGPSGLTDTHLEDRIVSVVRDVVRAETSDLRSELRQLQGWMSSVSLTV